MSHQICRLRTVVVCVIVTTVIIPIVKAQAKEIKDGRAFELRVIDKATQEPIPETELRIRIVRDRREDKTDQEGRCKIELGEETPEYIRIEVRKESFVPMLLYWRKGPGRPEIPGEYTLTLERGTSIGGIVHNEQGAPIEGVGVHLLIPSTGEIERVAIYDHVEKTNAEGRWRCDIIPSKLDDIWIRLSHPDYISDEMFGKTPKPPIEKLRDMTGVMVMNQGWPLTGRVFDANDKPIVGASVAQGSDRHGSSYPSTRTDSEGQFEFANVRPGEMVLTVQAKGYAPELKDLTLAKGMEPLEFHLEPGRTIRGRIVDKNGHPLAGAFVAADTWRGHRSLEWRVDTDAEGRFEWNEAPTDEVLIDMGKQGYMSVRNYGMVPSEQDIEITMPDILKVHGNVVDAETGESIPEFKIISGIDSGGGQRIYWQRHEVKAYAQGQYEIQFSEPHPALLIRIEAEGYKPGISRAIGSDESDVTIDFAIEKGTGPSGIVRLPDGTPAEDAEVILCTPSQRVSIRNGRNEQRRDSQYIETKEDGRFSFPVQSDVYVIVVLHDKGYLKMSDSELAESSELRLQPWATVKGKVLIGKNPVANETVRLGFDSPIDRSQPTIYHDYRTQTDDNGVFIFERVPPGQARVSRMIRINDRSSRYSHSTPVEVQAGQTVDIMIGGTGRPVTGKVLVPDYLKEKFSWQHTDYGLRVNSSEGSYRQIAFKINTDGTFRIDDVPAGDYYLYVNAYGPPAQPQTFRGERIGLLSQHFTIPEMPNGRSDEPLDLGALELDVIGKSDYAPSLASKALPDLDGIEIDFTPAQAKRKMVLVCFFDMNQRPSRHCITQSAKQVKSLEEKGITIIGIHASKIDESQLNEWVKQSHIPYPVGWIAGDEEKIRFNWGVKSMPWLMLTDKEHVVRAEGFDLNELEEKVKEIGNVEK
ncbi:MAG: carboxypeptidase regulatory-like domain-containing protein [Sedimentisphaerales bacterium]|nr:carboxypeptidase regulatory-like domain-containing protein [Sedimentisphaerales bacterium]